MTRFTFASAVSVFIDASVARASEIRQLFDCERLEELDGGADCRVLFHDPPECDALARLAELRQAHGLPATCTVVVTKGADRRLRRAALRAALSHHAGNGTLAVLDGSPFEAPSTQQAKALLEGWGKDVPTLVVASADEDVVVKSFRNLERVLVTVPEELEVAAIVWARSVVVTQAALPQVEARAGKDTSS